MKKHIFNTLRSLAVIVSIALGVAAMSAQNSLPAPGSGGVPGGGPGMGGPGFGGGMGPGFGLGPGGPALGGPWGPGPSPVGPTVVVNPIISIGNTANQGVTKVIANGYDAQGVWRVFPMLVSYSYNGVQYNVTVLNAWNPWTQQWDKGLDIDAYNTNFILRGVTYDFYAVLPYGTFYFNL